jgi:hypothetical protein
MTKPSGDGIVVRGSKDRSHPIDAAAADAGGCRYNLTADAVCSCNADEADDADDVYS